MFGTEDLGAKTPPVIYHALTLISPQAGVHVFISFMHWTAVRVFFCLFFSEWNELLLTEAHIVGNSKTFFFKETWQFQVVKIIFEALFNPHFVCQTVSNTIAEFRCCRLNTFNLFPCFSHLSSLSPHSSSTPNKTYLPLFCDKISGLKCTDSVC